MDQVIIFVLSCQSNRMSRQKAVRETWARRPAAGQTIYFVEGGHSRNAIRDDRIELTAPDGYPDLAEKTHRLMSFAVEMLRFDALIKCDDDTFLDCARIGEACADFGNYRGKPAEDQRQFVPYARGGCYWVRRKAVEQIIALPFENHRNSPWFKGNSRMRKLGERQYQDNVSIEDVMVGSLLNESGILLEADNRFHDSLQPPLYANPSYFSNHYVSPAWMHRLNRMRGWSHSPFSRFLMRLWARLPSAQPPK